MTHSYKKKRSIRKFKIWRKRNEVFYCYVCGKELAQGAYHLICNQCHNKIRKKELSQNKGSEWKNGTIKSV